MSSGNWSMLNPAVYKAKIYSAQWNSEFQNVINNCNPDGVGNASENLLAMQAVRDPYPGLNPSLATSLRQELESLRFQIEKITGEDFWYILPKTSIKTGGVTGGDLHDHSGTGENGGGAPLFVEVAIPDGSITKNKLDSNVFNDSVVNSYFYNMSTPTTISATMPQTTSPPTSSDGQLYWSQTITPSAIGNKLFHNINLPISYGADCVSVASILVGDDTTASYAVSIFNHLNLDGFMTLQYEYTTTSLDPISFKINIGTVGGSIPLTLNKWYGTSGMSTWKIEEIQA
jgi:hypothetical protein